MYSWSSHDYIYVVGYNNSWINLSFVLYTINEFIIHIYKVVVHVYVVTWIRQSYLVRLNRTARVNKNIVLPPLAVVYIQGGAQGAWTSPKGWFAKWRKALRCVNLRNYLYLAFFFDDLTQELNAKECKDRTWVYPSVALRSYKYRREGNAAQRMV